MTLRFPRLKHKLADNRTKKETHIRKNRVSKHSRSSESLHIAHPAVQASPNSRNMSTKAVNEEYSASAIAEATRKIPQFAMDAQKKLAKFAQSQAPLSNRLLESSQEYSELPSLSLYNLAARLTHAEAA